MIFDSLFTLIKSTSTTSTRRSDDVIADEKGAVMLTGVFMGAFLIGATWLIFGIARAAVFRERVQEAADSAAFSSAAIHAKGMNLIAAINLIFFAVTAIWVVLRTFEHVMFLLQQTLGNSSNCHGFACHVKNPCEVRAVALAATGVGAAAGASVCRMAYILQEVRDVNKEARQTVGDAMFRFFPPLSRVQDVTARVAPALGAATSVVLGWKFGHFTFSLSPSMIPANDLVNVANKLAGNKPSAAPLMDRPLGLPVVAKKFGYLCNRVTVVALRKVRDAFAAIPVLGKVVDFPIIKQVIDGVINGSANYIEREFCSDNDWSGHSNITKIFKEKGPKGMFGHAQNGNDLMQVWAFTRGEIDDRDNPRVAIAANKLNAGKPHTSNIYIAQAEFYFDCEGKWGDGQCNGVVDNAMYNMQWRARLRRLRSPNVGAELGRYLRDAAFSAPIKNAIQEAVGMRGPRANLPPDALSSGNLLEQSLQDGLFDQAWAFLNGQVTTHAGIGNGVTGKTPEGSFH